MPSNLLPPPIGHGVFSLSAARGLFLVLVLSVFPGGNPRSLGLPRSTPLCIGADSLRGGALLIRVFAKFSRSKAEMEGQPCDIGRRSRRRRREALSPKAGFCSQKQVANFALGGQPRMPPQHTWHGEGKEVLAEEDYLRSPQHFFPLSSLSLSRPPTPSELPIPNAAAFKRPLRSLGRSSYSKSSFPTSKSNVSGISQLCAHFYLYKLEMCLWLS